MILKAGTYRFNDDLDINKFPLREIFANPLTTYNLTFTINVSSIGDVTFNSISLGRWVSENNGSDVSNMAYTNENSGDIGDLSAYAIGNFGSDVYNGWQTIEGHLTQEELQTITILTDTEVDDTFGNLFITNTNYNEVNAKPLAEITYNGETIAQLNAGETATLSCKDKKMASDVVVKVNEPPIPEGYVKPEGTLELVFNNIEAEFPIDCSQYAKVTVNTAEPLKISDPTVLDNITDSPWGVGGNVFLYEGETTDTYENGTLYYLEDTEK